MLSRSVRPGWMAPASSSDDGSDRVSSDEERDSVSVMVCCHNAAASEERVDVR